MSRERFFCAAESRGNGESIYGTVARIRTWLLLEYPGVWRPHAIKESRLLPQAVKDHIHSLERDQKIDRSLLIRREHRRSETLHCFSVESFAKPPRMRRVLLRDYEELPDFQGGGEPVEGLIFAVCTHGRRDQCCAKFGLPVYRALKECAGDRAWQCSHVGGDRFAANIVVFPYGIYYGRAGPDDVEEIVRMSELGQVWLPGYRGRSCFTRTVQVAEYFARAESGRMAIDEFGLLDARPMDDDRARVRFEARSDNTVHLVEFKTRTDARSQRLTCTATELSTVPQYELQRYEVSN
jgi:hypothetical protein